MDFKKFLKYKYINIAIPVLVIILLVELLYFAIESVDIVSNTNRNNFAYTIKVRDTIEEIDKIVERAEVNINTVSEVIALSYDINKLGDEKYNKNYLKYIDILTKSALINSPGVEGAWFHLNSFVPFSEKIFTWYHLENGKVVNLVPLMIENGSFYREINPEEDPYYFQATRAQKIIWTPVYTDTDTKVEMMTIASPIYRDNVLIGVFGIDVSVADLRIALKNMQSVFLGSEIFLINDEENIVASQLLEQNRNKPVNTKFMEAFEKSVAKDESMIEYMDNGASKTAIKLALSNNYHVVITFENKTVFEGFERLINTVYFILFVLVILVITVLMNRINMIKKNKAIEYETIKLKTIVDSSPSIVIMKDLNGVYTDCNKKYCEVMGIEREDFVGKTDKDLFNEAQCEENLWNDTLVIETKKMLTQESSYVDKNGHTFYVEKYIVPIISAKGDVTGIFIIGYDITKRAQEKEFLKQAKEAAEKATQMKSSFLANMSHEIRTPMNGVFGFLQLLKETETSDVQKEFIEDAQKASELLLNVINEILDFSKIEAGKFQLDNVCFDVRSAVEDVTVLNSSSAELRGLSVHSLICSDIPRKVCGDPGRVKQILNNLLVNAIKFTPKGEVVIYVNKESETDESVVISFKVKDTGIGISEDKLKVIFDSFTQVDASTTRKFGGTGLGLSISKKLVDLMNGNITVESNEGEGSTFTMTVPFKKVTNDKPCIDKSKDKLTGKTILLVDTNPTNLKIVRYYLSELDCFVLEANSAEEALEFVNKKNDISVILVDKGIKFKTAEGEEPVEFSSVIKNGEFSSHIPIILCASLTNRGDSFEAKKKQFDGFLSKPVKKEDLISSVAVAINSHNNKDENFVTKHLIKECNFDLKSKILVVEDSELNCKLIIKILNNAGFYPDIAVDGQKGIEAFKTGKYDLILMDCEMPIVDGYQATREIRKLEDGKSHIPIIAMTANVLNLDKEKCYSAGMDEYLSKPIDINKLIGVINKYICAPTENEDEQIKNELIDKSVKEMMLELEFSKQESIKLFIQYLDLLPQSIGEMKTDLAEENFDSLKKRAHKLKGSSANMRIEMMAKLSEELQNAVSNKDKELCAGIIARMEQHYEDIKSFA